MSLMTYTAPAKRQNTPKLAAARNSTSDAKFSLAKITGASTNTFFNHWCGVMALITPIKRQDNGPSLRTGGSPVLDFGSSRCDSGTIAEPSRVLKEVGAWSDDMSAG